MAVFFNGQRLVTPVTASAVNDDAMQSQNLTVGNALAIVGKATGGKPKTALAFGSPEQARRVLRSGELLDAVMAAFDPSDDTGAPSTVYAVRVNPALQASLALKGAANATVINLTSANYGLSDNQIKVKVETGALSGKTISVAYGTDYLHGDNIGRAAFSVQYTGAEATAKLSVAADKLTLTAGATPAVEIAFADFATVASVVDKINSLGGYTAEVLERSDNQATLNGLDFVTDQDVKTAVYTVRADLQAIIDWFNNVAFEYVTAARPDAVGTLPVNVPYTFLTGGTDGNTITTDWYDGLVALQNRDVQWVAAATGDAAIHALVDTHVDFASGTLRRERRAILGTGLATTDAQALSAAKALNSKRTSLVHIGHYKYAINGKLELRPAYMTAALIAAGFAGSNPGTPLTNKSLKVQGLERDLLNPTDTDELLLGGVLPVENTDSGYKVTQSITTWLGDEKYNNREQSCGAALDFTVRNVREALDVLRGTKSNPILLSRAIATAKSTLTELAREEPQGPGVLAGDDASPAFRNITASIEGDVLRVQFECSPVIPNNYILVTVYARPYSGSATA
ncbi:phage tail sheath subtilisin-like domain-containing protein [Pseudomonas sp.]|uniref:phage tail sheath subtilisin-like domain-containing protein n=1 Tax=Pseudomonas sp. TaxID=306 RepID=UPI00258FA8AE|nr:phage tail sheath subtilisin-like domain-containing protein [Pseudomonas sp.]